MTNEPNETGTRSDAPESEEKKVRKWDFVNKQWAATIIFSGVVLLLVAFLFIKHEIFTGLLSYVFDVLRPITIGLVIAFILYRPTCQIDKLFQRVRKKVPTLSYRSDGGILFLLSDARTAVRHYLDHRAAVYHQYPGLRGQHHALLQQRHEVPQQQPGRTDPQIPGGQRHQPGDAPHQADESDHLHPGRCGNAQHLGKRSHRRRDRLFIGLIFSVYVLAARNKLRSQGRQILRHFLPEKHYHRLSHYGRLTFSTFSNFISGQLSDAFILGVLIFCVMSIGGLEYPMMIAVIIGITNMIPYVGPWMGTIPCALILLMVNPGHAIAFVIIVIIAQQIDSNLIYPRVVGTSVGLPAIWVLFAITVGGGLFGVLGMIVGVPVMSIIYTVMREKTASGTPNQPSQPEKKKHRWHIRQSVQTLYSRAAKRKNSENDHSDSAK